MDSGAFMSVAGPKDFPEHPVVASPGSKAGSTFTSVDGGEIPNLGQQTLLAMTEDGQWTVTRHQVADVVVPLDSVGEFCDAGNYVLFSRHGGCIIDENTQMQTSCFPREGGVYVHSTWIPPPEVPGFTRQAQACCVRTNP